MRRFLFLVGFLLSLNASAQTSNCNFRARPEVQQPTCAGVADGVIRINVDNPLNLLLTYKWTKILAVPLPLPLLLTNVATGLSTGDYQVIISSPTCVDTLKINLPEPKALQVLDTAICGIGGAINLLDRIQGGNGSYKIVANSVFGNTYNCNNCDAPIVNVDKKSIIDVEVVDQRGCQTKRQVEIDVLDSLKVNITKVDETCTENGAITARASGGSGTYFYALNDAIDFQQEGTFKGLRANTDYNIRVLDKKGCRAEKRESIRADPKFTPATLIVEDVTCYGSKNGSIRVVTTSANTITGYGLNSRGVGPVQTQPKFENLAPDTAYTVFVYEGGDCYVGYKAIIKQPDSLSLTANATNANCPGSPDGVVSLQAKGGNGGYTYSLNGINFQSDNRFDTLTAGNYKALVRDQKGCTAVELATVSEPERPDLGTKVSASCPNDDSGTIVIIDSGKFLYGDYSFSLDSMTWQSKNLFEGLAPGVYNVFVRYPSGCVYKVIAIVPEVKAPGVFFRIQPVSCPDSDDGAIVVEVTTNGETTDFQYSLDGENFVSRNAFKNLSAGDYQLYMRDSLDCLFTYPFTIQKPQAPAIAFQVENVSCFNAKNGKVTIQIRGGRAPFTYALNGINFQTSPIFDGLGASNYIVVVRDSSGCLYAQEASVGQPSRLEAIFTKVDATCGERNGVLVCTPSGGTVPYRYRWDTGDTTAVLTGLSSGNYRVSISDAKNCLVVLNAALENVPGPVVIGDLTNVPCFGMPSGAIELSVIGGTKPFSYRWSNGSSLQKINNLPAGNYTVTVTDKNQCTSVKLFNLYEPAPIKLQAQTGPSGGLWFINLQCEGGVAPYIYQWSTGETTEDIFNLKPAEYTVTVTDQQNCSQILRVGVGTTATKEPTWAHSLRIFPNPASEQLHISIESADYQITTAALYDVNGKIVLQHPPFSNNKTVLNINHLLKGIYLLRLQRGENILHRKIVVQ